MNDDLKHIYDISLFNINDLDVLLNELLKHTRELLSSEAGTIYLKEDNFLTFHVFQNDALSYENIYRYYHELKDLKLEIRDNTPYCSVDSLNTRKIIIIDDVYKSKDYDFMGVKEFDKKFEYKTHSLMTIPLIHPRNDTLLGVVQLLNKKVDGKLCIYDKRDKEILSLVSSFISLSLSKAQEDVEKLTQINNHLEVVNKNLETRIKKEIEENEKKSAVIFHQSKMASMGEMIGNIAHQWRQPLSSISTIASGLSLDIEMNNFKEDEVSKHLTQIVDTSKYLSQTIDDFRSFYGVDRANDHFNIAECIEKSVAISKSTLATNYIEFILTLDRNLTTYGLRNEFTQSILNIVTNAKDAIVEKLGIEDKRFIFIDLFKEEDNLVIKIKDNALGIDESIFHKIFEQHFTTKATSGGTGIGLFIVKDIITNRLNGNIDAQNISFEYCDKKYEGAEFTISFKDFNLENNKNQ